MTTVLLDGVSGIRRSDYVGIQKPFKTFRYSEGSRTAVAGKNCVTITLWFEDVKESDVVDSLCFANVYLTGHSCGFRDRTIQSALLRKKVPTI